MSEATRRATTWIVALLLPVLAAAQQEQTLRDRNPELEGAERIKGELEKATLRWGRVYLHSQFRLGEVSFAGPVYVPAGSDRQSLSFSVEAPQRLYYVPHRKLILSAEATPSYAFFEARNADGESSNGQFDYDLRGDVHFLFNHLYLDVYARRADELRAHVADLNRLATAREEETGVTGELKYSSRTSAHFTARLREMTYPRDRFQPSLPTPVSGGDEIQQLDRDERNGRVTLMHDTLPRTSFFVSGEASSYDFHVADTRNASRRWGSAGLLFDSGRNEVRIEAGPATLDFEDPALNDFAGPIGGISWTREHRRWNMRASWNRDVGFALAVANAYFVNDVRGVTFNYSASRRLSLVASSAWQTDRYDQPVNGERRRDDVTFSTIGFRHATRRLVTGLDLGWYERNSTTDIEEDSGIRYVLHLSFTL